VHVQRTDTFWRGGRQNWEVAGSNGGADPGWRRPGRPPRCFAAQLGVMQALKPRPTSRGVEFQRGKTHIGGDEETEERILMKLTP